MDFSHKNHSEDILNCSLKIEPLIAYNLYPLYCKVRLAPLDSFIRDILNCSLEVPKIEYISLHGSSSEIDSKIKLEKAKISSDINNTVCFDISVVPINKEFNNTCSLVKSTYTYEFNSTLTVPFKYEPGQTQQHNSEINNTVKIEKDKFEDNKASIDNRVFLKYDRFKTELDNTVKIEKINTNSDIDCSTKYEIDKTTNDIDCKITLFKYIHDVSWNNVIKVPSFRGFYTIPCEIKVVNGKDYCFNACMKVINNAISDLDCSTKIEKETNESDIDFSVKLVPSINEDILNSVSLKKINTRREIDCSVNSIGSIATEFISSIIVEPPKIVPIELSEEFKCSMVTGYTETYDIEANMEVVIPTQLNIDLDFTLTVLPKARIGILVDPLWDYEPFVLKSSLLTLFDKYFQKASLSIVYGGNKRSDWDIEHLGYVYKYHLIKVPVCLNKLKRQETMESIHHFIHHLFEDKVNKIFIFMNDFTFARSSVFKPLIDLCIMNKNVPLTLINSAGEYLNFNDYYQEISNRSDATSLSNLIFRDMIDYKPNKPSDVKHPYDHPNKKIVY